MLIFSTHYPELMDEYDRNDSIFMTRNREGIKAETLSNILKRNNIKKSDAYQSGFLEGTTPAYEVYMQLKKSIAAFLVRANYTNLQKGIHETTKYLEVFLRNLLLNEKNEFHNRDLHISGLLNAEKVDIEAQKVDIQSKKVDIERVLSDKRTDFSLKTIIHIHSLFEKYGFTEIFGRSAVMELLGIKSSGASKLLSNLLQADIIEPVAGHGKGKYKFKNE